MRSAEASRTSREARPDLKVVAGGPDGRDMASRAVSRTLLRTQSDVRLVALARDGHEAAFEAIVERYTKPLERYCRRILRGGGAEDAVQQTFMSAWSALERGTEVRDLKPWLYRIAHNAVLRAAARTAVHAELDEAMPGAESAAVELERKLSALDALDAVATLPERQREALVGMALEGRSREELALAMGLSGGAVRQLVHRAREAVRAAATVVIPLPLVRRLAGGGRPGALAERIGEMAAGPASAGTAGVVAKVVAVAAATGAVAAGPSVVPEVLDRSRGEGSQVAAVRSDAPDPLAERGGEEAGQGVFAALSRLRSDPVTALAGAVDTVANAAGEPEPQLAASDPLASPSEGEPAGEGASSDPHPVADEPTPASEAEPAGDAPADNGEPGWDEALDVPAEAVDANVVNAQEAVAGNGDPVERSNGDPVERADGNSLERSSAEPVERIDATRAAEPADGAEPASGQPR
jgi:RNA polymerase sigma factor (sigma-70 family)